MAVPVLEALKAGEKTPGLSGEIRDAVECVLTNNGYYQLARSGMRPYRQWVLPVAKVVIVGGGLVLRGHLADFLPDD